MASDEARRWSLVKQDRIRLSLRRRSSAVSPPVEQVGLLSYDHDAVDPRELAELLGLSPNSGVQDCSNSSVLAEAKESETRLDLGASVPPNTEMELPESVGKEAHIDVEPVDIEVDVVDLPYLEAELPDGIDTQPITLWFDPPADVFDESSTDGDDEGAEVTDAARAKQLAIRFLEAIGELNPLNVTRIVEIILARKWSRAQLIVKDLLNSGFDLEHVHQAFLVSEAWRQCDALDERLGAEAWGRWSTLCRPRISWLESVRLVEFVGSDMTAAEVMDFADAERHVWRTSVRLRTRYPRFKDYLFSYRIADESPHRDVGWFRTLDPRDGRFFDGTGNPEFTPDWWDDELPSPRGRTHLSRLIYQGCPIDHLIPDASSDMDWFEGLFDD